MQSVIIENRQLREHFNWELYWTLAKLYYKQMESRWNGNIHNKHNLGGLQKWKIICMMSFAF